MNTLFDLSSPATDIVELTPNDNVAVVRRPRSLRIDGDGVLQVQMTPTGTPVTFSVYDGEIIPIQPLFIGEATTVTVFGLY